MTGGFDHTILATLMRCEQEAVYRHVRHLTSPEESLASFFGRVVHEGIRVLYAAEQEGSGMGQGGAQHNTNSQNPHVCTGSTDCVHCQGNCDCHDECDGRGCVCCDYTGIQPPRSVSASCAGDKSPRALPSPADCAAEACGVYWQREVESGHVYLAQPGPKPDHRSAQLAATIVRVYASLYGHATSRGYDVVMNERYLAFGEERGIVDRVVRRHADGLLYVLDLKTSSWAANAAYWRQWSNSQQAAIYLDLVEAELGEGVAGFWCDHIYVSGRKAGPEPEDFMQFGPVTYSIAKRDELRRERQSWRETFGILRRNPVSAKQSTRSCIRFQSACPYLGYCGADPQDREDLLSRDLALGTLVVKPWNPAGRDE